MSELTANALIAFGQHKAIGYAPFSVDTLAEADAAALRQAYAVLAALSPAILRAQSAGRIRGAKPPVAYDGTTNVHTQTIDRGECRFTIDFIDPWTPREQQHPEE